MKKKKRKPNNKFRKIVAMMYRKNIQMNGTYLFVEFVVLLRSCNLQLDEEDERE